MKRLLTISIITTLTLLTIFFAISRISITQHISQHQYQQQTQIQKNENVNLVYQNKFTRVTNEVWKWKWFNRPPDIINFINTLSYHQKTRMRIIGNGQGIIYIYYPVINSNPVTVTNFNKNSNKQVLTNDIRIKYPFAE